MYEIGACLTWSGKASEIIGPIEGREKAADLCCAMNKVKRSDGRQWWWARWEEIGRAEGCTIKTVDEWVEKG